MKKLCYLLFLLFSISPFFSQEKYAKIIYSVSKDESRKIPIRSNKNKEVNNLMSIMGKKNKELKLVLEFSKEESYYSTKLPMNINYEQELIFKLLKITFRTDSDLYISLKDKIILEKKEFLGEEFLIHQKLINNIKENWRFSSETKKIKKYNCYKATRILSFTSKGEIETREQIVWYAPEISNQFGPIDFVGFPGLVLEVKDGNLIYLADEINLNLEKKNRINKPSKGKKVTKEEYDNIVKESTIYYKRN